MCSPKVTLGYHSSGAVRLGTWSSLVRLGKLPASPRDLAVTAYSVLGLQNLDMPGIRCACWG